MIKQPTWSSRAFFVMLTAALMMTLLSIFGLPVFAATLSVNAALPSGPRYYIVECNPVFEGPARVVYVDVIGFLDPGSPPGAVTFTIDVPEASVYRLSVNHTTPWGAASHQYQINNGAVIIYNYPQDSDWLISPFSQEIELVQGYNTIRIAYNSGITELRWIEIENAPVKTITVGEQSGILTAGAEGLAAFAVNTANIANGSYAVTLSGAPAGVSAENITIDNNSGTLTLNTSAVTPAGSHTLTATIDGAASNRFNLIVGAAAPPTAPPADPPIDQPTLPVTPIMTLPINGINIHYTIDTTGVITLFPTETQINQIVMASANGHVLIDVSAIPGARGLVLQARSSWFNQAKLQTVTLRVNTLGSVTINKGTFISLVARNQPLLFSMTSGSLVFDIFDKNSGSIGYNDPTYPLFVSIPFTHAADTTTNSYVVVRRSASGNVITPYSVYRSGEIVFHTACTGAFEVIYNAKEFTDTRTHWASGHIDFASARGIVGGIGDNLFSPDTSMTRAMFAQVLANIEGIDLTQYTTSRFTDVAVDEWYAPAIEWAASARIVGGYGNGRFGPSDSVTREQMAGILTKYAKYKGYELPTGQRGVYADESSVSPWAIEAVKSMQGAGIITGKPGNRFEPREAATRAEVVTMVARFIEVYLANTIGGDSAI